MILYKAAGMATSDPIEPFFSGLRFNSVPQTSASARSPGLGQSRCSCSRRCWNPNTVRKRLDAKAVAGPAVATLGDCPRDALDRPVGRSVRGAVPEDVALVADGYWDLSRIFWDGRKADLFPDGTASLRIGFRVAGKSREAQKQCGERCQNH